MTAVESALERRLSRLMREARLPFRRLAAGATLMEQGTAGREIYIVLDGLLAVELDGQVISEVGPGAFLGELAALEHDVMLVSVVPAHLHDRPRLAAALATVLGVDPMRIAAKFEPRQFDPSVAVIVAEIPANRQSSGQAELGRAGWTPVRPAGAAVGPGSGRYYAACCGRVVARRRSTAPHATCPAPARPPRRGRGGSGRQRAAR